MFRDTIKRLFSGFAPAPPSNPKPDLEAQWRREGWCNLDEPVAQRRVRFQMVDVKIGRQAGEPPPITAAEFYGGSR